MSENLLAGRIAQLRKEAGMTQEQLGNALGLTYQSVSKWENGLSCPDVQLLPQLADLFHVTLDDLFGREAPQPQRTAEQEEAERTLPWPDDDTLYAVMYHGHQLLTEDPAVLKGHREELRFVYDGPVVNVSSWFDVVCESGPVEGSVTAGGDVKCGEVGGSVTADGDVACDAVGSGVQAGGDVHCAGVEGNVTAGGDVACGEVTGDVRSGGDVACGSVGGSVRAGGDVVCRKGGDGFVFTTGERNVEVSDVAETVEDIRQTAKGLKDSLREMFRRKPSEEE